MNKTFKEVFLVISIFAILLFLGTMICGPRQSDQPYGVGAAASKCTSVSFKEASEEIPSILFEASLFGFIYFFIGYGYNLSKFKKQLK